jgi:ubiquinone/menaquinone biosynthesis C-methylase UbiE
VYAIDISDSVVEMTGKSFELFGITGNIRPGSMESIRYDDNSFDYVISNGVIHQTPGTERVVEEFYRVLNPSGVESVCIYYRNFLLRPPFLTIEKILLINMLKKTKRREAVFTASTPDDFVCTYDGNNTPIAKFYAQKEADMLFRRFETLKGSPH